jgi:hypothetical protein
MGFWKLVSLGFVTLAKTSAIEGGGDEEVEFSDDDYRVASRDDGIPLRRVHRRYLYKKNGYHELLEPRGEEGGLGTFPGFGWGYRWDWGMRRRRIREVKVRVLLRRPVRLRKKLPAFLIPLRAPLLLRAPLPAKAYCRLPALVRNPRSRQQRQLLILPTTLRAQVHLRLRARLPKKLPAQSPREPRDFSQTTLRPPPHPPILCRHHPTPHLRISTLSLSAESPMHISPFLPAPSPTKLL